MKTLNNIENISVSGGLAECDKACDQKYAEIMKKKSKESYETMKHVGNELCDKIHEIVEKHKA